MAHWAVQIYLEAEVDNHNIREIQASSPMDQKRAACVNLRIDPSGENDRGKELPSTEEALTGSG